MRFADQAVCIGPAPSRHSYLNLPAIIEAALQTGADAVHPGYGFLSEVDRTSPRHAQAAGLTFVGPPPAVIGRLGDKSAARAAMADAGLPMLPGSVEPIDDAEAAAKVAADVGYPVIVKAVAGGGGRGMRVVDDPGDLPPAATARCGPRRRRSSATTGSTSSGTCRPRATSRCRCSATRTATASTWDSGTAPCSAAGRRSSRRRRRPACRPTSRRRDGRGRRARGCSAAGYVGAGTVEFLVDDQHRFYFMEVNCRIQVEHPVTELTYGVDLVREQLRIAAGRAARRDGRTSWRPAAWPSSAGSTPRTRRATSCPPRAR